MKEYFLCLNPTKTKILVIAPPNIRETIIINGTFLNNSCIRFVRSAKNLGVILDEHLSFEHHVKSIVKSCFMTIRKLAKIKSFLLYEQLRTLISACVFSILDYCNSLYHGITSESLRKLQSVQNAAARLLRKKDGNCNLRISYFIRKHHWLRVQERIWFKTCLIVHKSLQGNAPVSLSTLLFPSSSARSNKLNLPASKNKYGERRFSHIGPKIWNLLPISIRTEKNTRIFKISLKTFLFGNSDFVGQKLHEC